MSLVILLRTRKIIIIITLHLQHNKNLLSYAANGDTTEKPGPALVLTFME